MSTAAHLSSIRAPYTPYSAQVVLHSFGKFVLHGGGGGGTEIFSTPHFCSDSLLCHYSRLSTRFWIDEFVRAILRNKWNQSKQRNMNNCVNICNTDPPKCHSEHLFRCSRIGIARHTHHDHFIHHTCIQLFDHHCHCEHCGPLMASIHGNKINCN